MFYLFALYACVSFRMSAFDGYNSRMIAAPVPRRARVHTAHEMSYTDPLAAVAGTRLILDREDDEFPGWVWCAAPDGREGWVPRPFLMSDGTLRRDYDARELTVARGDALIVFETVNGWCWAASAAGKRGWVPAANLDLGAV